MQYIFLLLLRVLAAVQVLPDLQEVAVARVLQEVAAPLVPQVAVARVLQGRVVLQEVAVPLVPQVVGARAQVELAESQVLQGLQEHMDRVEVAALQDLAEQAVLQEVVEAQGQVELQEVVEARVLQGLAELVLMVYTYLYQVEP